MEHGAAILENSLTVSQKVKHKFIIQSGNSIPRYPPLKWIKTYVHTKNYTEIFTASLFIMAQTGNNPNVHQLIKLNSLFPCNETLLSNNNNKKSTDTCHAWMNLKNILKERSQTQKTTILYDSICTKCLEKANQ